MSDREKTMLSAETRALLWTMQRNEFTESLVYAGIAAKMKPGHNQDVLLRCADEERSHGAIWRRYLGEEIEPNRLKARFLVLLAQVLGFTFVLKLMENSEASASRAYATMLPEIPEAQTISAEEKQHENALIAAVSLGYESCWVEGHITDADNIGRQMADVLGVPQEYELICYLPIGKAIEPTQKPVKRPISDRAWFNGFGKEE